MFESLLESLSGVGVIWIYAILLIAAYLENIIPPIPGDTVVIFGAYLVGLDRIEFIPSLIVTTIGSLTGFMTYYYIGSSRGRSYFEKKNYKWFNEQRIAKVIEWFSKWGVMLILVNRFLAGTRSVVSICAGFVKMGWMKVATLALISSFVWNGILITAGYYAGRNWKVVEGMVRNYNYIVSAIILIFIITAILLYKKNRESRVV